MALAKSRARSSIYLGVTVLLLCTIAVVCGAISTVKLSTGFGATIGLWALYFFVPGILFIMAGFTKRRDRLKIAATTNIIGLIVTISGLIIGSAYWARLNECSRGVAALFSNRKDLISSCVCGIPSETFSVIIDDDPNCSKISVPRKVTAVATMMHLVLGIVSFVSFCYSRYKHAREPTLVVAATVPFRPSTVSVVFTNHGHGASYDQPVQPYPSVEQQRQSEIATAHNQQRFRQNHFELAPTVHSNQVAQQQQQQQQQQQPEQQQQEPPPAYSEHVLQQHYTTRIVTPVISQHVGQDYPGIAPPPYSEHVAQHESSAEMVTQDRTQQVAQQHYPGIDPPVYSERCRTTITEQRTSHVSYNTTTYL